jgi:hypothetical protein
MRYILVGFLVIFASSLDIFSYRVGIVSFRPSQVLLPAFFALSFLNFGLAPYLETFKTHTFKFLFLFLLLSVLYGFSETISGEVVNSVIGNSLISLLFYTNAYLIFKSISGSLLRSCILITLLLLAFSVWYDTFVGFSYVGDNIRKGGFAENPNTVASSLKFIGLAAIYIYRERQVTRMSILLLLIVTVFITLSRGGLLSIIVITLFVVINQWSAQFIFSPKTFFTTAIKFVAIAGTAYFSLVFTSDFLKKEVPSYAAGSASKRIDLLLGKGLNTQQVQSNDTQDESRVLIAKWYLNAFADNPFGNGTGYSSDRDIYKKDTHNYYLKAGIDFGIIGFFVLLFFMLYGIKLSFQYNQFYYFVLCSLLIFECFISHSLFVERAVLISIAFFDTKLYKNLKES